MRAKAAIVIVILAASVFLGLVNTATAQATEEANVTVSWNHVEDVHDYSHDYERERWMFGPQPAVTITYADNGTSIADNEYYVEPNVGLLAEIIIPHTFLGKGNPVDTVKFSGIELEGSTRGWFRLKVNITKSPIRWTDMSLIYEAGSSEPISGKIVELDYDECTYSNETDHYRIVFAMSIVAEELSGVYYTSLQVLNADGVPAVPSWLAALNEGTYRTPPLGLNQKVPPRDYEIPRYFMAELTNLDGDLIHYVDVDEPFVLELTNNYELEEVFIPFCDASFNESHMAEVVYTWPENPFDEDTTFHDWSTIKGLSLFMTFDGVTPEVVLGHEDITWEWTEWISGLHYWKPHFGVDVNASVPLSNYYTVDTINTVVENGGATIKWAGALTERVDLCSFDWEDGGVIRPSTYRMWVEDVDGKIQTPRIEIAKENTLSMAFKTTFVEAIVTDANGDVIRQATHDELLNATFKIHGPLNKLNGSYEFYWWLWEVRMNTTFEEAVFSFKGSSFDSNDTHYWFTDADFNIELEFDSEAISSMAIIETEYWLWDGTFVEEIEEVMYTALDISDWNYDVLTDTYAVLSFEFVFTDEVPALVIYDGALDLNVFRNYETKFFGMGEWQQHHSEYDVIHTAGCIAWSPTGFYLGTTAFWEPEVWTVTDDGAIDLDGNIFTTDDQYYVKRVGHWHDEGNVTYDRLDVSMLFDPSVNATGDEYWTHTWVGMQTLLIEFEASEKFYWYHTDDLRNPISSSEMESIKDILWVDDECTVPSLGHKYVAWLTVNKTITLEDIPGADSNVFKVTWLGFGSNQIYNVAMTPTEVTLVGFRAHYAGLLLFNDIDPDGDGPEEPNGAPDFYIENKTIVTDEVTHFFVIDEVGSIEFRLPFGSTQESNTTVIPLDEFESVDFGATIYNVNGTIYPINIEHSRGLRGIWQLRESAEAALGLNQTCFDYAIETASIEEMGFDVHFTIDQATYDPADPATWNHQAKLKVDHYIGEWDLHNFDNSVLDDRGLAVNYFGVLGVAHGARYDADETPITDTDGGSVTGNTYNFGNENGTLAEVKMGGMTYTWGGDSPPHSVEYEAESSTIPVGVFSAVYESSNGDSFTDWQVSAEMLFMTTAFTNWGGHSIDSDPVFVAYTSALGSGGQRPGLGETALLLLVGGVVVVAIVVLVLVRRRR